jgi:hypothetical protein
MGWPVVDNKCSKAQEILISSEQQGFNYDSIYRRSEIIPSHKDPDLIDNLVLCLTVAIHQ